VETPEQALTRRLKELRRKHFGPQGAAGFAERLGLSVEDYQRFERGTVPPGEVLVRICEVTGEDLQWLLTGVAGRGTVVIAGTRTRHQALLTRLAHALDQRPELAAPVEAFLDLLVAGPTARAMPRQLPPPRLEHLIPIFEADELPPDWDDPGGGPGRFDLARYEAALDEAECLPASCSEPAFGTAAAVATAAQLVFVHGGGAERRSFVHSPQVRACFPDAFGVHLGDAAMQPMFTAEDVVVVCPGVEPRVGRPAVCRVRDERRVRCRIWLGYENDVLNLGRLADEACEEIPRGQVLWSVPVLYRVARAA
jgi:transcriptional regulator with XRE-family HTH domain